MTTDQDSSSVKSGDDVVADELRSLEHERCRAISELDRSALERLLDEDLTHIHANGMTQNRQDYLAGLQGRPRHTRCGSVQVRRHGDVAVLTGMIVNSFSAPDGPVRSREMHALRVWRRVDGEWRLLAFAASGPVGPAR